MKVGEGMQEYCISVVIPVYNCENQIQRCLNSLNSQDFNGKFEIIIVNDGSTDDTSNSCSMIISNMNIPCKLIQQPNSGVSAARNTGIKEAKGEYLIFVDGDDTLEIDTLSRLFQLATVNQVEMSYGGFRKVNKNGRLLWMHKQGKEYYGKMSSYELIDAILKGKILLRLGTFLITKSCLLNNGIYFYEGCRYGEDTEFILKCLLSVTQVYGTRAVVYNYFENTGSVMNKVGLERFEFIEGLKRLEKQLSKVKNKNRVLSDSLFQFFIPYGIMFHIDVLLGKKVPANEIVDFLTHKNYYALLQTDCLLGINLRISRKARLWIKNPEAYAKRIYIYRRTKFLLRKTLKHIML